MKYIALLTILTIFNSYSQKDKKSSTPVTQNIVEKETDVINNLIQESLDLNDLQWFFIDENQLYVLNKTELDLDNDLNKFDKPIIIKDSVQIVSERIIHYLIIENVKIESTLGEVHLYYPSQGAGAIIGFRKINNKGIVDKQSIWEN